MYSRLLDISLLFGATSTRKLFPVIAVGLNSVNVRIPFVLSKVPADSTIVVCTSSIVVTIDNPPAEFRIIDEPV